MFNKLRSAIRVANKAAIVYGSAATLLVMGGHAFAQEELEEVVVQGVRAAQASAVNTKRDAASVVDGISAQDIGKLPDVTISDSLQRIPGIQVERTAGEGGPVQIRGLANVATSLNGETYLSATTIDSSGADFGDLPSQLFSGADVYKSPLATLTTLGIAGTVELKTRRPFDLEQGWTFSGSAEVDQGSISKESDPTVSGLIGWNNADFGFVLSAVTTEKNLASNYNGYFDSSENGGIGATFNNHYSGTPPVNADIYHVSPQGFGAFHKVEERQRDGINASFQAQLTDGIELVVDYFYSDQERYNRRAGFSMNNRWQTFSDYLYVPDGKFLDEEFTMIGDDGEVQNWRTANAFEVNPYRLQSFSQTNVNLEESENTNIELNFDNGEALTGQVRATHATASAQMLHGYTEGDMLSIDKGSLVTGPGGLVASKYCGENDVAVGDLGGCYAAFSPGGIEDPDFILSYDASGKHPVFGGFDQVVTGGQGNKTVAEYMASIDSYHVGAFASEGNTRDEGELSTLSTKWNYAFDDAPFITSVDFGARYSERKVDHQVYDLFSDYADTGCSALYNAVDQFAGTAECDPNLPQGEMVNGEFENYSLMPPMRSDQYNDVIWVDDFGPAKGIPGVWVANPRIFDNTKAFLATIFGPQREVIHPGSSYDVGLDELSYFGQVNFAAGDLTGNLGVKVVETDLYVKQNIVGGSVPHSGASYDIGDEITKRSYTDVLPALNLSYDLTDDLKVRFGYGETMQPLNLLSWGGGKTVGRVFNEECQCMRVLYGSLSGNPELDPTRADNTDLSIEWYVGNSSVLSAGLFNINIDSFLSSGRVMMDEPDEDGVNRGPHPFTSPVQGEGGKVEGLELAAKVAFADFTDGFLANFGADVNYTLSESSQDGVGEGERDLPFPNNSKHTYNLVGWFENDTISARLAYNFRSPRLIARGGYELGYQNLYQDDYGQLDLNVTWSVTENVDLYLNGANITEEFQQTYLEHKDQKAFQNIYEARWSLGARTTF
ncbi:MAG: TonB-dependent receptor [Cellvibrio sp.]|uniref:TonB-dependent receptor n=1 Tax=Cellvibrio sp. TaxID=1965322 RepID=UPI0031AAA3B1